MATEPNDLINPEDLPAPVAEDDLEEVPGGLPWLKRKEETEHRYRAFLMYLSMGPERSIAELARQQGKHESLYYQWSHYHNWYDRAEAFDAYMHKQMLKDIEHRIREEAERDFAWAQDILAKAKAAFDARSITRPQDALAAMKLGLDTKWDLIKNIQDLAKGKGKEETLETQIQFAIDVILRYVPEQYHDEIQQEWYRQKAIAEGAPLPSLAHEGVREVEEPKHKERVAHAEQPTPQERVTASEEPMNEERADEGKKPIEAERSIFSKPAGGNEDPTIRERAQGEEEPRSQERATHSEEPTQQERAVPPENTKPRERAKDTETSDGEERATALEESIPSERSFSGSIEEARRKARANLEEDPTTLERVRGEEESDGVERATRQEQPDSDERDPLEIIEEEANTAQWEEE